MWTCSLLKRNAKQALDGRYWRCFIVALLVGLAGAGGLTNYRGLEYRVSSDRIRDLLDPPVWTGNVEPFTLSDLIDELQWLLYSLRSSWLWWTLLFVFVVGAVTIVLFSLWTLFVANPLRVGRARYFMESRQAPAPISTLFSTFRRPYLNLIKVMFLTSLKILLGLILFVIPGIYWAYCYRQVPYLLAENPYLTTRRAMELSREMMQGEKLHTFVLDLSFAGWVLLCAITLGFALYAVEPYYQATQAELYAALRSKAFALGLTDDSELGGFVVHDSGY